MASYNQVSFQIWCRFPIGREREPITDRLSASLIFSLALLVEWQCSQNQFDPDHSQLQHQSVQGSTNVSYIENCPY